jgi:co-chaperonin GroES (HSP10)
MATRAMEPKALEPAEPSNIIWVGNTGFEASDDHLIVVQDEHKSGFECPVCLDKEHRQAKGGFDGKTESIVDCDNCDGKGRYTKGQNEIRCTICDGSGKVPCAACRGTGSAGGIVIPESTKGRPTTGVVMSVGENITKYKLGDRVCYPSFAGHAFDLTGVDPEGKTVERTLVIHIERDILAKVHGTLEKRMVKKSMALHTAS